MQHSNAPLRKFGNETVLGLGLGNLTGYYKKFDPSEVEEKDRENLEFLTDAADAGQTFWDTSDFYGPFTCEETIGKWFKLTGRRKEIFLCTKFGVQANVNEAGQRTLSFHGDKKYVKQACEASLKRLQTDYIDLYYQHRVDPKVRIEETVGAMAELVKKGKVRHLGLSECSTNTLRRAHKVHPIAALEIEYSLFTLDIEREEIGLKKACDELGVAIVAYSPLGRGFLTGQIKSRKDLEGDARLNQPRFSEANFDSNLALVRKVEELAKKKDCKPSQLALAWLLRQGNNVIPIPGTRNWKYLEENLGSLNVTLTHEDIKEIRELAEKAEVKGTRYPPAMMADLFFESI